MSPQTHSIAHAHSDDSHGHGHVRAEPDIQSVRLVFLGLIGVVVAFLVGIFWAYRIQLREEAALERTTDEQPGLAARVGHYEVGVINQQQFEQETRSRVLEAARREHLDSYGWINREKGLVHLPIELGEEKFLSTQTKERK